MSTNGRGGETVATRYYLVSLQKECDYNDFDGQRTPNHPDEGDDTQYRQGADTYWFASFDASGLTKGQVYKICSDHDGFALEKGFGDTFLKLYILELALSTPGITQSPEQEMRFACADCIHNQTAIYLTSRTDCDFSVNNGSNVALAPGITSDSAVLLSNNPSNAAETVYKGLVNASPLTPGNHYYICMDLDGASGDLPFGYTEVGVTWGGYNSPFGYHLQRWEWRGPSAVRVSAHGGTTRKTRVPATVIKSA